MFVIDNISLLPHVNSFEIFFYEKNYINIYVYNCYFLFWEETLNNISFI